MEPLLEQLYGQLETERARIEQCVRRLPEDALWKRLREGVNSIGNLCLHLAGNESHYLGRGIGGTDYVRDRPGEFDKEGGVPAADLLGKLAAARTTTAAVLEKISSADFDRPVDTDHPKDPTVLGVILHVTHHYAYHTGQIVLQTRLLQDGTERVLEWGH